MKRREFLSQMGGMSLLAGAAFEGFDQLLGAPEAAAIPLQDQARRAPLSAEVLPAETQAQQQLYNGIRLGANWPPSGVVLSPEPMTIPYLENPPKVIQISIGRQLFVDDFLIETATLKRTYHHPEYYSNNPVIKPDRPWEMEGPAPFAGPFSGGVWFDHGLFKIWYTGGYMRYTCYATSKDGIHWEKPNLDVVPGTNIVIDHTKGLRPRGGSDERLLDTNCVWIDYKDNGARRYKIFYTTTLSKDRPYDPKRWYLHYCYSRDGIHWSEPEAVSGPVGDHTNAHYNPFRDKWVIDVRYMDPRQGRARAYVEGDDPGHVTSVANDVIPSGGAVPWLAADKYDPHNPGHEFARIVPQLYQFDGLAYESVMLGFFSIWQGPENGECARLHIQKRNEVVLGYSRDDFHYYRPDRRPFYYVTETPNAWNWGNCQSAAGACVVVGDKLYLYFSARDLPKDKSKYWDGYLNTGLAFLRRDGFASMDSIYEEDSLTTRPVQFDGKHLFVNTNSRQGQLRVEVLDAAGSIIEPFTKENCQPITVDKTLEPVSWKGGSDLSLLTGRPVRFKFYLRLGELYSFWVSRDESGASHGYVGSGGPGFTGSIDL
jgi:hypothetical protein